MCGFNQMQDKILFTLRLIVDAWELEWVEILESPSHGTIRLMQAGGFRALLKIEYEFQPERCRLLVYREGKHILGRCNIDYDDGLLIERLLRQFQRLLREALPASRQSDAISSAEASRRSLCGTSDAHP